MWKQCPDCKREIGYIPFWSWLTGKTEEQCSDCHQQEQIELHRWEGEGGNPAPEAVRNESDKMRV